MGLQERSNFVLIWRTSSFYKVEWFVAHSAYNKFIQHKRKRERDTARGPFMPLFIFLFLIPILLPMFCSWCAWPFLAVNHFVSQTPAGNCGKLMSLLWSELGFWTWRCELNVWYFGKWWKVLCWRKAYSDLVKGLAYCVLRDVTLQSCRGEGITADSGCS